MVQQTTTNQSDIHGHIELSRRSTNIEDGEKFPEDQQVEVKNTAIAYGHNEEDAQFMASFDEKKKKQMYRKVDWRLIPMLAFLYLVAYIDRANLGNAKIEGIDTDLGIVGSQWNVCVSVFFISYVICGM